MNLRLSSIIILLFCICSCNIDPANPVTSKPQFIKKNSVAKRPKPVFGYRFVISGDFDGDGKQEKLIEHFCDSATGKEVNKYYGGDYDYDVKMLASRKCYSSFMCDNNFISATRIEPTPNFGLLFLKNEGDLNGDGSDEISLVTNKADWSSLSECTIMTYKHGKWDALYWFPIWEWQLPNLPRKAFNYKLFGVQEDVIDTEDIRLLKELNNFSGLVKKINNKKLQIIYRSPEMSADTIIVNLKDHHPKL